jgi:hypothetical protein
MLLHEPFIGIKKYFKSQLTASVTLSHTIQSGEKNIAIYMEFNS